MAGIGRFKLSDALGKGPGGAAKKDAAPTKGKEKEQGAVAGEQSREALESAQAKNAEASIRGHMVEIGRGNQQAGRQQGGGRRGK